jgi:hypothetical protein
MMVVLVTTLPPSAAVSAAGSIAGRPVQVHCARLARGVVGTLSAADVILLSPDTCRELRLLLAGRRGDREADAVLTLAHEAVHVSGLLYETDAECVAAREAPALARRLVGPVSRAFVARIETAHRRVRRLPGYGEHPC